ncbi:MAG: hypothetical protein HUU35_03295 [Armatimonadetes bacterium]|nr:hypothetical protein [Armatimonadota bacterium]
MGHRAVFTHNDLDGLVSAMLARVALPDAAIYFCDYNGLAGLVRSRLHRYDVIWFADLSMRDDPLFDELREAGVEVYWFDHHASSQPQPWMAECRIVTSGAACAADVVRDYVVEQGHEIPLPLQTLVDYAHDQDLWIRAIPEAQSFNDILGSMMVQDLFDELTDDLGRVYHWTERMQAACEETQAARQRSLELAEATSSYVDLPSGERVRAACCWGSVSEVGDSLGDANTLVVLLDLRLLERGVLKYSFRTQSETLAANVIAERLGGGGHPKASGAPLGSDILRTLTAAAARQIADVAEQGD